MGSFEQLLICFDINQPGLRLSEEQKCLSPQLVGEQC